MYGHIWADQLFTAIRAKSKCFCSVLSPRSIELQLKSSSSNKHYGLSSIMCFIAMKKQTMVLLTHMLEVSTVLGIKEHHFLTKLLLARALYKFEYFICPLFF